MNKSYDKIIFINNELPSLLESIEWTDCLKHLEKQGTFDYEELSNQLLSKEIDLFIYPLSSIPFDRNENIQLAAVSARRDEAYYLQNSSETKNLAFLGESQKIHYNQAIIEYYVRDINQKVQLEQTETKNLSESPIAIHTGNQWSQNTLTKLSVEEFTPPPASGVYVLVCRKSDTEMRKKMAAYHHGELMELSNIERKIQRHYHKRKDIEYVGARIEKDANAYIHGTVALLEKNAEGQHVWRYFHHSQSTTDQFVANILQLNH